MKRIFILTQEGRAFSTSGLRIVRDDLEDFFNVKEELVFEQGASINNKKLLFDLLQEHPDSFLALSTETSIDYLPPQCLGDVFDVLKEDNDKTSWQALCDRLKEERKLKEKK